MNSQASQRNLEYRQFELPVRRIPTGDLVPHTENTVKRFKGDLIINLLIGFLILNLIKRSLQILLIYLIKFHLR